MDKQQGLYQRARKVRSRLPRAKSQVIQRARKRVKHCAAGTASVRV